jgi:hypothetical protein
MTRAKALVIGLFGGLRGRLISPLLSVRTPRVPLLVAREWHAGCLRGGRRAGGSRHLRTRGGRWSSTPQTLLSADPQRSGRMQPRWGLRAPLPRQPHLAVSATATSRL